MLGLWTDLMSMSTPSGGGGVLIESADERIALRRAFTGFCSHAESGDLSFSFNQYRDYVSVMF